MRDGGGTGGLDLVVNVGVLQALQALPGDYCECSGGDQQAWSLARLWPKHELPRGVAEVGRLLLLALGVALGEHLSLRRLGRPLLPARQVSVQWEGGGVEGLARAWRGQAVWQGAALLASRGGRTVAVAVVAVDPAPQALVGPETRIVKWTRGREAEAAPEKALATGQLRDLVRKLRRGVAGALAGSEGAARGLVLWGPAGCGKTWLLRHVFAGRLVEATSVESLREGLRKAREQQPSVLLVDEADKKLSPQEGGTEGAEGAASLMSILDTLAGSQVAVVVAVRRPDVLPMALRRAGRLEIELEVGPMSGADRRELLRHLLPVGSQVPEEMELPGMVAGDVAAVAREARICASMRGGSATVSNADVVQASKRVQTGAARGWEVEMPRATKLEDARGMKEAKRRLTECIEWPLRHAAAFERLGVRPASGLLLYGPPGNGKTLLARGAASQMRCSFLLVKGPELYSKYVGESERALAAVFQQARRQHPCLIFLDEIDALAPKRSASAAGGGHVGERMLAVLLSQLDGVSPLRGVTVVGATNRPDQLDAALLRPGRLSHLLYIPLPDAAAREDMLAAALLTVPKADDVTAAAVAAFARERCEGCSGAECAAIAREAKLRALSRADGPAAVRMADLEEARTVCPPRTSPETIRFYEEWRNT